MNHSHHTFLERRTHPRRPYEVNVEFIKLNSGEKEVIAFGKTLNICKNGIAIITDLDILPGQVLIYREVQKNEGLVFAMVCWTMKKENTYIAGMRFL